MGECPNNFKPCVHCSTCCHITWKRCRFCGGHPRDITKKYPKPKTPEMKECQQKEKEIEAAVIWDKPEEVEVAKVAIILTSFNRPRSVKKAIESVLAQTYRDFHLYIMDNNSCKSVRELLRKYEKHPKVTLFITNTKNEDRLKIWWLSRLINKAISMGEEPYITPMCDDVWWERERLEFMIRYLDGNPNAMVCYCSQKRSSDTTAWVGRIFDNAATLLDHNQIMYRRKLNIKWEERFRGCPDAKFFAEVASRGHKIYPIPQRKVLEHHVHLQRKLTKLLGTKSGVEYLESGGMME